MVYNVEDPSHMEEDLKNLRFTMELLKHDSLGGHGSRGYGKVDLKVNSVRGCKVGYFKEGRSEDSQEKTSFNDEVIEELKTFFEQG